MRLSSATLPFVIAIATTAGTAAAHEPGPFDVAQVDASKPLPAGVKAKGKTIEQVWTWTDGDMTTSGVAVLSSTDTVKGGRTVGRKLFVQYYRGKAGKLKQVRLVQDGAGACDLDLTAAFVPGSVQITDADGDEISELSFAYDLRCAGDVSPATRKLIVLEGPAKHALRGESRVDVGNGETVGGTFTLDGFKKAPELQAQAEAAWKDLLGK